MMKSGNAVVVGGGLAGLAAAIYLKRAGLNVTLFEKRRHLGGRAVTHLRHGYRFNLGPHALYQRGAGAAVLRELGVPIRGGVPATSGIALHGDRRFQLPANPFAMLTTRLFTARQKIAASKLMWRIRRGQHIDDRSMTAAQWVDANVSDPLLREFVGAMVRVTTYCGDLASMNAAAVLAQIRLGMRGVIYLDEGWQKIVDALHSTAVTAGVNFITSSRVVAVDHDDRARGVIIGGLDEHDLHADESVAERPVALARESGARIPADVVVLAVDPITARAMLHDAPWSDAYTPVVAGCLDVALSRLPQPKNLFALGIDRPHYYSVHSRWAQLTPKGGALIHLARYGGGGEEELEALLDELQPGWRGALVYKRFMPSMIVSNAIAGTAPRPSPKTTIAGVYLAGDWVGDVGMLSDAALASARAVIA